VLLQGGGILLPAYLFAGSCICRGAQGKGVFSTCLPDSASIQVRSRTLCIYVVVYMVRAHSQFNACAELHEAMYM